MFAWRVGTCRRMRGIWCVIRKHSRYLLKICASMAAVKLTMDGTESDTVPDSVIASICLQNLSAVISLIFPPRNALATPDVPNVNFSILTERHQSHLRAIGDPSDIFD